MSAGQWFYTHASRRLHKARFNHWNLVSLVVDCTQDQRDDELVPWTALIAGSPSPCGSFLVFRAGHRVRDQFVRLKAALLETEP